MAEIIPFRGLRYNLDIMDDISDVTTPPYDVISPQQQEAYYSSNPYNSIRLELSKELPADNEYDNKYIRAGNTLQSWIDEGILFQDEKACLYIYQQEFDVAGQQSYIRTGLIGLIELEEFEKGTILPHENTLSKPKADRLQLMRACNANFSQVFCLYEDSTETISELLNNYCISNEPDLATEKGIANNTERVWAVSDPSFINKVQQCMKNQKLYIADGHHRYETALAYKNELKSQNPNHTGDELYNYVMMMLVEMEDPGLVILPTHRMVNSINAFEEDEFLQKASEHFIVEEHKVENYDLKTKSKKVEQILGVKGLNTFVFYGSNKNSLYSLSLKEIDIMKGFHPNRDSSYQNLDVSILHTLLLERILGIGEKQLANQEHLAYTHSIDEGIEEVDKGNQQMTFFISATTIRQIQEVSLAGEKMPQKSTYFYPKLLTGLVFNKL